MLVEPMPLTDDMVYLHLTMLLHVSLEVRLPPGHLQFPGHASTEFWPWDLDIGWDQVIIPFANSQAYGHTSARESP